MKEIKFAPLRKNKDGNVVVASYNKWTSVRRLNISRFKILFSSIENISDDLSVFDSKGNMLFFYDYSPFDVPVFDFRTVYKQNSLTTGNKNFGAILWEKGANPTYNIKGADCCGVPAFNHYTDFEIMKRGGTPDDLKPLTVKTVKVWVRFFLSHLKNAEIVLQ